MEARKAKGELAMAFSGPTPNKPPIRGIYGTGGDDSLDGTRGGDTISGLGGKDTIFGFGGNDWLYGGEGHDTLDGGDGNDHLFGGAGWDKLYGGDDEDWLYGGDGHDELYGGAGDDHLYAGDGAGHGSSNRLNGGAGADELHGGSGKKDVVDYSDSPGAVEVNLGTSKGAGSDAQGDIYYDIESIDGSAFDDILIGSGASNTIYGDEGDDQIFGLGDDDTLIGGEGGDYLDGGAGNDLIEYGASNAGVTVNLTTGTGAGGYAQGDTYYSIEDVFGTQFDDTLIGNASANVLVGGQGADTLFGGGGQDTLRGGDGQDTLTGGGDADIFRFGKGDLLGEPFDYIMDFSQADGDVIDLSHFEGFGKDDTFAFLDTGGFTGAGWELRYEQIGGETIVSGDVDGDGQADFEIHCVGTINFTANDFLL
jgi:Ca2+-binding RTX toxin-like protein